MYSNVLNNSLVPRKKLYYTNNKILRLTSPAINLQPASLTRNIQEFIARLSQSAHSPRAQLTFPRNLSYFLAAVKLCRCFPVELTPQRETNLCRISFPGIKNTHLPHVVTASAIEIPKKRSAKRDEPEKSNIPAGINDHPPR